MHQHLTTSYCVNGSVVALLVTDLMGACQLNSSPSVEGAPASCADPCKASSSSVGQSSLAEVGVAPYCLADTWGHPALARAQTAELQLKDPAQLGAVGISDFATPGYAAAAAVATAAAASEAAPTNKGTKTWILTTEQQESAVSISAEKNARGFAHMQSFFTSI